MSEQIAKFRFKGFKVLESHFKSVAEFPIEPEKYGVDLVPSFTFSNSNQIMVLILEASISTENKLVDIYIKAQSTFEFDSELNDEEKQNYFRKNAPAIMFPYIRAYISSLSVLSGIPAITLPTINLTVKIDKNAPKV